MMNAPPRSLLTVDIGAVRWNVRRLRSLLRRVPLRSMTVVGDLAQRSSAERATSWRSIMGKAGREHVRQAALTVSNNGRPFPDSVDIHKPASIGLQLVRALTDQLRGTLCLTRDPETTFVISFPLR